MNRKDSKVNKNRQEPEIADIMNNKRPGFRMDSKTFEVSFAINDFILSKLIFL